jgi:IclR family transcriptional regulator, pca regulon regulatory protein
MKEPVGILSMNSSDPLTSGTPLENRDESQVRSIENALRVLQSFSHDHPSLTISEAANLVGITRGTARRVLITFASMGLVTASGRNYIPTARIMTLGYGYLSSLPFWELSQSYLEELQKRLNESCSIATLDGPEIVYVARAAARRSMSLTLTVGSRLPAYATSMGRVLLAGLDESDLINHLASIEMRPLTPKTITSKEKLVDELRKVRRQGYAIVDGEREEGVRSAAAPIRIRSERVAAALNVSTNAGRVSLRELRERCLPALIETADAISGDLSITR